MKSNAATRRRTPKDNLARSIQKPLTKLRLPPATEQTPGDMQFGNDVCPRLVRAF